MTKFTLEQLRQEKGFRYLKVGDVLVDDGRQTLLVDENSAHEYPFLGIQLRGESGNRHYVQVVHYRVEPIFKDSLQTQFGRTIHSTDNPLLYLKAIAKLASYNITPETERKFIERDWRLDAMTILF